MLTDLNNKNDPSERNARSEGFCMITRCRYMSFADLELGQLLNLPNWYRLLYVLIRVTSNILCCNEKKLIHAFHHCAIIENLSLKSLSKPHDMVQIDGHIALLCKFQDVLSAIIAAGRGIKDHIGTVFDQ